MPKGRGLKQEVYQKLIGKRRAYKTHEKRGPSREKESSHRQAVKRKKACLEVFHYAQREVKGGDAWDRKHSEGGTLTKTGTCASADS